MAITSPNYTQYPNEILDEWMPKLSNPGFKVLSKIIRQTFGWNKECDRISISQLMSSTGLARQTVIDAIRELENFDLINVKRQDNKTSVFSLKIMESGLATGQEVVYQVDRCSLPTRPQVVYPLDTQKKEINLSKEIKKDRKQSVRSFKKPTIPEIENYLFEKKINIDAEQFFNFYESKNWMIGKNKMSNWHAAIATWVKREKIKPIRDNRTFRERNPFYDCLSDEEKRQIANGNIFGLLEEKS